MNKFNLVLIILISVLYAGCALTQTGINCLDGCPRPKEEVREIFTQVKKRNYKQAMELLEYTKSNSFYVYSDHFTLDREADKPGPIRMKSDIKYLVFSSINYLNKCEAMILEATTSMDPNGPSIPARFNWCVQLGQKILPKITNYSTVDFQDVKEDFKKRFDAGMNSFHERIRRIENIKKAKEAKEDKKKADQDKRKQDFMIAVTPINKKWKDLDCRHMTTFTIIQKVSEKIFEITNIYFPSQLTIYKKNAVLITDHPFEQSGRKRMNMLAEFRGNQKLMLRNGFEIDLPIFVDSIKCNKLHADMGALREKFKE